MKFDENVRRLLDAVPDMPTERHTKDELLQTCGEFHALLTEVRKVLLNLVANAMLIIGKDESDESQNK